MAYARACGTDISQKFIKILQNDLKNLSIETKKKFPSIKESCEEGLVKLRNAATNSETSIYHLVDYILHPIVQGCETKDKRIVTMCLGIIQRLITNQAVDEKGATYITDTLWMLMESGTEKVKVLQTVTLLLTTNAVVHGDTLSRNIVLCFRLHFAKDSATINAASATVRQVISLVFDRVVVEDEPFKNNEASDQNVDLEELKTPSNIAPKGLRRCAGDAYLLFQDLLQLVNDDQPYWLIGMIEITRTFGLELLESVLKNFTSIFFQHPEFSFLLKRVCILVIKLFSPNIKYRSCVQQDMPYFPINVRLFRVVFVLVEKYHSLLITECEIFLSSIVKFLDPNKPMWQRSLALEVLHKLVVQPELLISFCECYDLKALTTNIFQEIVNSLGAYVQPLFVSPQLLGQPGRSATAQVQPSALHAGMPVALGVAPQPGFFSCEIWLPVMMTFSNGLTKCTYLEMIDKTEPPMIPDGYGISVAYACLLVIVKSVSVAVQIIGDKTSSTKLYSQLISSSWCGLLAGLSPLLDASTNETITKNVLKAIQTFASLCGSVELQTPRDAFITAICKASLPPHYTLTSLLNSGSCGAECHLHGGGTNQDGNLQYNIGGMNRNEVDYRRQVVAVSTLLPMPSIPLGYRQGPVMLTAKNLQCMRAVLSLALSHGAILGTSWHLVLTTLQHLVWILGLKPSTGGSLRAQQVTADTNAAAVADLHVLSAMLSRLFESSQFLNDVGLYHLIDALCKLSHEAMELAYCNRKPSLFAVAKLLETGLANLPRVEILWRPLTNHLLEVCQHPHIKMRELGAEAITCLVKAALQHTYQPPLKENQKLQTLLISPLAELSSVPHGDVRQRQLDCVLHFLHGSGEALSQSWPLILTIIGAVKDEHGGDLIRIAFQCLQLVVSDFLPLMSWHCLPLCLETTAKFGSQTQELNTSLTAIGLMWTISDHFFHNKERLQLLAGDMTVFPDFPGTPDMPEIDKLWMCLYSRLGDLCVDLRPAVRKSAGQTLFSTINAHAGLLATPTWQAVLWQVLFPLLDKVRSLSISARNKNVAVSGVYLIHHTRNTAQKQWAETQVLTLSGVAKVFNNKRYLLQTLGDFPKAWSLLLEFVENAALSKNNESSLAALRSFKEILCCKESDKSNDSMWDVSWRIWVRIALDSQSETAGEIYVPSQLYLATLVQIFPSIFQHVKTRFSSTDLHKLCEAMKRIVNIPIQGETSVFLIPTNSALTRLQEGILHSFDLLIREAMVNEDNMKKMICPIFKELLALSKCAYQSLSLEKSANKPNECVRLNQFPFGEKALQMVISLYVKTAHETPVIEGDILKDMLKVLNIPLSKRYDRQHTETWKLAVSNLFTVLSTGIPLARQNCKHFTEMWPQLAVTLDQLLFPRRPSSHEIQNELLEEENVDCQVIDLLKEEVLSHASTIPKEFMLKVVVLLNKGSILSTQNDSYVGTELESNLREELAKVCFETLLQFSLLEGLDQDGNSMNTGNANLAEEGLAGRLAVTALLHRFQEVLQQYVKDESRSGKCPLPRYRLSEISFVLKAVATLISSLKKSPEKVNSSVWDQLICLYPFLIDCTTTTSVQVSNSLREALLQYCDLLKPPTNLNNSV